MATNFFGSFFGVRILTDCCYKNCYEVTVRAYGLSPLKPQRGRRENFLTPSNSHLIRIPITVFITSVRFFSPKSSSKFSAIKDFLNSQIFLELGIAMWSLLGRKKIQKGSERGMECEVND